MAKFFAILRMRLKGQMHFVGWMRDFLLLNLVVHEVTLRI
jgi:hypothetical protein